ncbi:uncharacterized protein LOC102805817, partial [Saccoglossus kowalevskii]|uniref:Uncharacterized protein LOC102805817 n=1 Tax=Saccoglossus kowalevskii TaxID=10224 RepID=A0ABM0MS88_SACKO
VLVEDLNNDGKLEIVVTDSSVNVMCLDSNGDLLWDASLPGVSTAGSRVADINDDQILDVVIATNIGYVVAFRGDTGEVLPNWPKTLGNKVLSNVLISRIKNKEGPLDILVPTYDGSLHVISGDGRCSDVVWLGEQSLVQLLAADLHKETPALELLVSTMDGTLMCLHTSTNKSMTDLATVTSTLHEWTAETNTHNSFTFWDSKVGVEISESTRQLVHVTGMSFVIEFTILDEHKAKTAWNYYHIKFLIGSIFLHSENFSMPGQYMVTIPCPHKPVKSSVQVEMRNQHGQVFTDSFPVSMESYLINIKNIDLRTSLAKFRLSDHALKIETGRHNCTPLSNRVCDMCNQDTIENEFHFMVECPKYSNRRSVLFDTAADVIDSFHNLPPEEQFTALLNNDSIVIQ